MKNDIDPEITKEGFEKRLKTGVFKIELDQIAKTCLEISGTKTEYTNQQLADSALPFMEVFMNKMFDFHKDKITPDQMEELAEEAGKSLRQTVLLFTGVDLHKAYD